ncbi:MAG: hypothetical protein ACF8MJ_01030 [Phycisphaerales bacterium JB050]
MKNYTFTVARSTCEIQHGLSEGRTWTGRDRTFFDLHLEMTMRGPRLTISSMTGGGFRQTVSGWRAFRVYASMADRIVERKGAA